MIAARVATLAVAAVCLVSGCGAEAPVAVAPVAPVAPAAAPREPADRPSTRPRPQYLTRTYQAPPSSARSRPRPAGVLRVPSLRIAAPVLAVGLDRGVMTIPDSPARVGWLRTTAAVGDRIGASVLSGHVSDRHDRPGALSRLHRVRRGAQITWTGADGVRHRFVVARVRRYPRARGVPASLFRVVGPHVLHLVTCAERVRTSGGGFHYTANLVVTAREVPLY